MAFESITDDKIFDLINCPKRVMNPNAKLKKNQHLERITYNVEAVDGSGYKFVVYKRQNLKNGMEDDFSTGIVWIAPSNEKLTLRRYNGPSHNHPNMLEKEKLGFNCHIHHATEKYIRANLKSEGFAEITDRFISLKGAFACLVKDCKITNISFEEDITTQFKMF